MIERVGAGDLRELATERAGAVAQVGVVLALGGGLEPPAARDSDPAAKDAGPAARASDPAAGDAGGAARASDPAAGDVGGAARASDPAAGDAGGAARASDPAPGDAGGAARVSGPAAKDVGPAAGDVDLAAVREALAKRITGVPRLRQRLVRAPFGGGRPFWVDDHAFDIRRHVKAVACPAPGDETALLAVAAGIVTRRLPADRPLWSVTLVTGLTDGRVALVMTLHHVVADGIGGLAVLAHLVDGAPSVRRGADFPRPAPSRRALLLDAARTRLRWLTHPAGGARPAGGSDHAGGARPAGGSDRAGGAGSAGGGRPAGGIRRLRPPIAEIIRGTPHPPRSSLNQPTGPDRRLAVARTDLAAVQQVAHDHGATVNDVILTAVSGALHALLRDRGETVDRFVITVPVSGRRDASAAVLGNRVAIMTVPVVVAGDPYRRLSTIARTTRDRKPAASSESAALLGLALRGIARLGVLRWFVDRQRMISTFVTNLRGPGAHLSFLAAPVTDVIPVSSISGNVTVGFAAMSYAGTLVVTVVADPRRCPDQQLLAAHLRAELDRLTAPAGRPGPAPAVDRRR